MKELNSRNWEKYDWNQRFCEAKLDAKVVHVVHTEVAFNPTLNGGIGDVEHINLDPFALYWDAAATCIEDARRITYAKPIPTSVLRAKYPNKKFIKPDIERMDNQGIFSGISSPTMDTGIDSGPAATGLEDQVSGGEPLTKLIRIWLRDDSVYQETEQNGDTKEYVLKKKYPNGRYIEIANNKVLRDGPIGVEINGEWVEYKLDGMLPISRLVNYAYPRRYAGENEVTHGKGPQKVHNYAWSYVMDLFKASNNPKVVVTHAAGDVADEITNETTAPVNVGAFSAPTTPATALSLGTIPAGCCRATWVKRTAANTAALADDGFELGITGDTAA